MVVLEPFAFRWKGIFTQLMKAWVTDRSLLAIPWLGTLMFRYYIQVCTLVSHLGMYLYTYDTYIYIYIYVLMDIYACTYAKRMCVYIYIYTYVYGSIHSSMCVYIYKTSLYTDVVRREKEKEREREREREGGRKKREGESP